MPKAVKWRQTKNCTIMFDLLKLIQKKQELQFAFSGNIGDFSDSFRDCYGCEGNCAGNCSGSCEDTCENGCTGCGNTTTSGY